MKDSPGYCNHVDYVLRQNFPNPFNPSTAFRFAVPKTGHVTFAVYNMLGQKVRTLVDEIVETGTQAIVWDGKDSNGISMPSGTYIYRMIAGSFVESHKMFLVK
jgi:flagellar hook assembly protein FlgD